MNRLALLAIVAAGLVGAVPSVRAQGTGENEDARYSFYRTDEGYLRLEARTGQVSLCTRRPAGWLCQLIPDERAALDQEIARLQGENVTLKKELLAHNLALPGTVRPEPAARPEPDARPSARQHIDTVMTVVRQVWRRLVEMIVTVQNGMLKRT